MYNAFSMLDRSLKSDLFLYLTYGMVESNPENGIAFLDDLVKEGKVRLDECCNAKVKPTPELCQSIKRLLSERGKSKEEEAFSEKYKSFMA